MRRHPVRSADGTWLRTWTNDVVGIPVVISNGLGTPPAAWPLLCSRGSGLHVVTWSYRGFSGSDRPEDPKHVRIEDHADDLRATVDSAGMERALIVGWSVGVNVAFEFARQHPERVAGILAVAGTPRGSLSGMFGSVGLPRPLREPAGRTGAWMLRIFGPWMASAAAAIPLSHHPLSRSGLGAVVKEAEHAGALNATLRAFRSHDWEWFSQLVLAAAEHEPVDVRRFRFPVTFVAGRHDSITSSDDVEAVASIMQDVRVVVLPSGTHFLPLQYPERMLEELLALARRAGLTPSAAATHTDDAKNGGAASHRTRRG